MADEVDKGQATGSIQGHGDVRSSDIAKFGDLGLDRRRVAEWRDMRDAGEGAVEGAIQAALAEGRAPTKNEILEAAKAIRAEKVGAKRAEKLANTSVIAARNASLPIGERKYSVIYADPPWSFEVWSGAGTDRAAENHYPTMTQEQIEALPVHQLGADDCALFMWAVMPQLPEALRIITRAEIRMADEVDKGQAYGTGS